MASRKVRLSTGEVRQLNLQLPNSLGAGDYLRALEENNLIIGQPRRQVITNAAAQSSTAIHAAITMLGTAVTVTTAITQPDVPRAVKCVSTINIANAMPGASDVVVYGTDIRDNYITESIDIAGASGTYQGALAFKTINKIVTPVRANVGDTVSVGTNEILGLDDYLEGDSVIAILASGVYETTRPTVKFDATIISKNTILPDTGPDGAIDYIIYYIPAPKARKVGAT